ncbi:MAG: ABC transporter permease [Burkholderiales bacterium]
MLATKQAECVEAACTIGAGYARILVRHMLANSMAPILVHLTFVVELAVLAEAVLSFIGVGFRPPAPTFGDVVADGRNYLAEAPWICAAPGVAVMTLVIGLNLLGDGLRDVLDPRLRLRLELR